MYKVPILFIIFSRPDTTTKVFERIREIKPTKLYIAADAPRENRPDEAKRCVETRAIVENIDWTCDVKRLYRDNNLGCKIAVSSAINWFFGQEEYGVILEDDCLPDLSFFPFCAELLEKYKDDERIGHIGGNCSFPNLFKNSQSYDFCSFPHIWGWASWRRVWKNYDVDFKYWEEAKKDNFLRKNLFKNLREKFYFSSYISDALSGKNGMNTWDTQYLFSLRIQNQLSIYPSVNLVTNIGLSNPNGTNTTKTSNKKCIPSQYITFPLQHPKYIMSNCLIDKYIMKYGFFSYTRILRYLLNKY